ncbi:hypothetical protein AZ20_0228 [Bordetella bronchiseptica E014]|nr:hypothetical protein L507_0229 [Bordetella bronchiseptica CA90 BB02]KDC20846.1 hypothetical protein AZ20_0228 [Bordetella bronchiseptica E014]KDC30908.1 hypothetical protein L505_0262 [Bordetella bronchiseptica F4563]
MRGALRNALYPYVDSYVYVNLISYTNIGAAGEIPRAARYHDMYII